MPRPVHRRPYVKGLCQGPDNYLLRTMFWNAGGLTHDKFTELKNIIATNNIDIYGVAEAGAATDSIEYFQVPGYQTYLLKRARQVASGIVVGVKSDIIAQFKVLKEMSDDDKLEAVEIEVWKSKIHRRIFYMYNPPNNKPNLNWLEATLSDNCVVCGDLNAPSTRWGYPRTDATGKIVEDFIDSNPVQFMDNEDCSPSFLSYSGSTSHPDLVLAHSSQIDKLKHTLIAAPTGFGHKILIVNLVSKARIPRENKRTRWNIKKADWKTFSKRTDELLTEDIVRGSPDKVYQTISGIMVKCALETIPRGQVKRYSPFWNDELQRLKEERDEAREEAERNVNQTNLTLLKKKNAAVKATVLKAKRSSYRTFLERLDYRRDGVKAHRFLSKLNNSKVTPNCPIKKGNKLLTNEKEIAGFFCKHFSEVSNFHPKKANRILNCRAPPTCANRLDIEIFESPFHMAELDSALKATGRGKSAGPDDILPEFILNIGEKARVTILKFLNLVWATHVPAEWKKAEIIPILKKGKNAETPESYRPISLTSTFSKVYERMIYKRLNSFLEKGNCMSNNQAGFKSHRSTTEQVARLTQEIKDGFQRKQSTLAVFVDFKAAFDRVYRKLLFKKLQDLGVQGKLYKSIVSWLTQRYVRVRYNNAVSSFKQTRQGLPQGSVISPLLFNILIDDIAASLEEIPGINVLLYADDVVMWASSSNVLALEDCLNSALNKLSQWATCNEMVVNPQKTEYQLFTMSTKKYNLCLRYQNNILPRTEAATYLGLKLDPKLNWGKHADKLVEVGEKRMTLMKRLTGTKWGASQDVLALAYKSYVRPAVEYGTDVAITASDTVLKKLDQLQNKALRLITGGTRSCPITAMELQTGIEPLDLRREMAAISLYERVKRVGIGY